MVSSVGSVCKEHVELSACYPHDVPADLDAKSSAVLNMRTMSVSSGFQDPPIPIEVIKRAMQDVPEGMLL